MSRTLTQQHTDATNLTRKRGLRQAGEPYGRQHRAASRVVDTPSGSFLAPPLDDALPERHDEIVTTPRRVLMSDGPANAQRETTLQAGQLRNLIAAVLAAATAPPGGSPADIVGHYRLVRAELGKRTPK
jgi:hypothetical protein